MSRVRVCFVCTGNICRSPTAHGVMSALVDKARLSGLVDVDSAGISGYHVGELPDPRSRGAARARGLSLTHRARVVLAEDFTRFDYLLAMDTGHLRALELRRPAGASATVALFRDFDPTAAGGSEVPDPYYGGDDGFEQVLDMCERACAGLLSHIVTRHGLAP